MSKQQGKVSWAVALYIRVQQSEKALDRNEQTLHSWLSTLTPEEAQEYAATTMRMDAEKEAKEAA